MDTAIEHAERISALEVKVVDLREAVAEQTKKIDELLGIVQQARGARYALVGVGAVTGAMATAVVQYGGKIATALQMVGK